MLDFKVQAEKEGSYSSIRYTFYEKLMASPLVFHSRSFYNWKARIVTLGEEIKRTLMDKDRRQTSGRAGFRGPLLIYLLNLTLDKNQYHIHYSSRRSIMCSYINSQRKFGITYIAVYTAAAMYYTSVGLEKKVTENREQRTDTQRKQLQRPL